MPATMRHIAAAARVSPSTVSQVLNGRNGVSAAVAQQGARREHRRLAVVALFREALDDPPAGLYCTTDRIALGALKAFWNPGLAVPGRVSVVGFNDFEAAAYASPPLTAVHADIEMMGRIAVRRLLERAREPHAPPMTITMGVRLVERQSVGPAPGSAPKSAHAPQAGSVTTR